MKRTLYITVRCLKHINCFSSHVNSIPSRKIEPVSADGITQKSDRLPYITAVVLLIRSFKKIN